MHVDDVARAFVAILDSEVTGAINVASGRCITLRQVIDTIAAQLGCPELIQYGAKEILAVEPPRLAADVRRLHTKVGFKEHYSLSAGLADTVKWWHKKFETAS